MKTYSEYQFAFFRILFGLYLAIHFLQLIPHAGEIFSREGVFADPALNFFHGLFPNALLLVDTPLGVTLFLGVLAALSFFYALGLKRRIVALLLWYGWACLFNRNNLIANPSLPYVGWLLLASCVIPSGERLSVDALKKTGQIWQMPALVFNGAWILLALGYTVSGLVKLKSPSWVDGTAMMHLLENPLARDYFLREWFLAFPPFVLKLMAWISLALEILFAPLCLWRPTRALVWLGIMGMHLGIVTMVNFTDLTLGMFMVHLFTFDARWLPPKRGLGGDLPVVFFDGVCGLCNHTVDFFIREDKEGILKFSPLQGAARKRLLGEDTAPITTIIYLDEKGRHQESEAIILMLGRLGGLWKVIAGLIWFLPVPLRNFAYRWISKNRYRLFGKKDVCRMPAPDERARFLN